MCGEVAGAGGTVDDAEECFEVGGDPKYMRSEAEGYNGGLRWTVATDFANVASFGLWRLYFENDGEPDVWLSSADWMGHNLFRRVEVAFRGENEEQQEAQDFLDVHLLPADTPIRRSVE